MGNPEGPPAQAPVLRIPTSLVGDELHLDGLHGCDCQDGLRYSSPQAAKKARARRELALVVHHDVLELLKGAESDGRLWDGAINEDREASVQPSHSVRLHSLLATVPDALVLANLERTSIRCGMLTGKNLFVQL